MISKTITSVLILIGIVGLSALMFNHISPWFGIAVALVAIYLAGKQLDKPIDKDNK